MCRGFYDPRLVGPWMGSPPPRPPPPPAAVYASPLRIYPPARLSSVGVGHCWPHYYITREMESWSVPRVLWRRPPVKPIFHTDVSANFPGWKKF